MPEMFLLRGRRLAARSFKMVGKANKTRYGDQLQRTKNTSHLSQHLTRVSPPPWGS